MSSRPLAALLTALAIGWLAMTLSGLHSTVQAQTQARSAAPDDIAAALDAARLSLEKAQKRLAADNLQNAELIRLRDQALAAKEVADNFASTIAPQLANVTARLAELGALPAGGSEAADIAAQRSALEKNRAQLDAQLKLARLLSVEGDQIAEQIYGVRRSSFQARLGERTSSILTDAFWADWRQSLGHDNARLKLLGSEFAHAAGAAPMLAWVAIVLAAAGLIALRAYATRKLPGIIAQRVPAGRLRRSFLALIETLLTAAVPALIAHLLRLVLSTGSTLSEAAEGFLVSAVGILGFGGYFAGLGKALLSPTRPTWRLPPVLDVVAQRMRGYPLMLALAVSGGALLERLAAVANFGLASVVAINCVLALAVGILVGHGLVRGERVRRQALAEAGAGATDHRPLWLAALAGASWLTIVVSLICLLIGYVALGSFIVKQVVWISALVGTAYLVNAFVDDAFMTLLAMPDDDNAAPGTGHVIRNQAAVLLSAVVRLTVLLVAAVMIAVPFGQGPAELIGHADQVQLGISIGQVNLRPSAVLQALLVFAVGMYAVRVIQHWLNDRYFPTTHVEEGMRSSATTLIGYVGVVLAVALALSAAGLGLERIAWVASALSVGIGFGLQAVVSNFVSGLILLAERPVRVGDWVSLGGVEGDIRRINVRATEIQMGDRSTVIVPNSEFITKTVRNVTHANPLGLVQIKMPMPLDTDVDRVHSLMLAAYSEHSDVLETPAPNVFLDGIESGSLIFNATGFVSSPRQAYGAKSALLFDILRRLREAGLAMSKPPTMLLQQGSHAVMAVEPAPGGTTSTAPSAG